METTLKQRLIGAAVIIALAVIFVPMILDGSGQQKSIAMNMEVPPEPKFSFETDLPDPKELEKLPVINKKKEPKHTIAEDSPVTTTDQSGKESIAKTNIPAKDDVIPEVVEATANHIKPQSALGVWAVQVAAFSEKEKAIALQKKLKANKFPAFTERTATGTKVVYRVKVGPELKKENAEKLRDKIEKQQGIKDSFVISHP